MAMYLGLAYIITVLGSICQRFHGISEDLLIYNLFGSERLAGIMIVNFVLLTSGTIKNQQNLAQT